MVSGRWSMDHDGRDGQLVLLNRKSFRAATRSIVNIWRPFENMFSESDKMNDR